MGGGRVKDEGGKIMQMEGVWKHGEIDRGRDRQGERKGELKKGRDRYEERQAW